MTITNGQLISPLTGQPVKNIEAYLADGREADRRKAEANGYRKPGIEANATSETWAEAQKRLANEKAGRIQQSIDQTNRNKAAEAERCATAAENPAAFIAANGGFGALDRKALNKVEAIAQITAADNQRKADAAAKLAEVRNDEWSALVTDAEANTRTLHPSLQGEAAELAGFIRNASDPADLAAYKTRAHDLLGRQLAILDSVAAAKLAAHQNATAEFNAAAAAANQAHEAQQ